MKAKDTDLLKRYVFFCWDERYEKMMNIVTKVYCLDYNDTKNSYKKTLVRWERYVCSIDCELRHDCDGYLFAI